MSFDYQVLIKTSRSLSQIAAALWEFTEVRFARSMQQEEEVYSAVLFDRWMELYDTQGFVDDKDIAITQYQYGLNIYEAGFSRERPEHELWHEQIAKMIACFLARVYAEECVVMRNIERVVERFPSPVR